MTREDRKRAAYLGPRRRRPVVLEAAAEIFAECGYGGARMEAIAARAGVRKPVVYDCFPGGKAEIFLAALASSETMFQRWRRQTVAPAPRMGLEAVLRWELTAVFSFSRTNPAALAILLHRPATAEVPIADAWQQTHARLVAEIELLLAPFLARDVVGGSRLYAEAVLVIAGSCVGFPGATAAAVEPLVALLMRGFAFLVEPETFDIRGRDQLEEGTL